MLFYTCLNPFPLTRQVWDLAFILALPEAAVCPTRARAVCAGLCVLVLGTMTMHVVGTWSSISLLS